MKILNGSELAGFTLHEKKPDGFLSLLVGEAEFCRGKTKLAALFSSEISKVFIP